MYFTKYIFWEADGSVDILAKDGASLTKDENSGSGGCAQNATKWALHSIGA